MRAIAKKLKKLLDNAYSPYSKVKVSALVITNKNEEFKGVNVENAVYPAGLCAERVALFSAIANGTRPGEIAEIHIYSSLNTPLFPCGQCLQVMAELVHPEKTKIFIHGPNNYYKKYFLKDLIPHFLNPGSFGWKK